MYLMFFLPRCFRQGAAPVRSDLEHRRIDTQILAISTPCKTEPLCWEEGVNSAAGASSVTELYLHRRLISAVTAYRLSL